MRTPEPRRASVRFLRFPPPRNRVGRCREPGPTVKSLRETPNSSALINDRDHQGRQRRHHEGAGDRQVHRQDARRHARADRHRAAHRSQHQQRIRHADCDPALLRRHRRRQPVVDGGGLRGKDAARHADRAAELHLRVPRRRAGRMARAGRLPCRHQDRPSTRTSASATRSSAAWCSRASTARTTAISAAAASRTTSFRST